MYDITQRKSFENISKWLGLVKEHNDSKFFSILLANKVDLENERTVSTQEGQDFAKTRKFMFRETSAKTNQEQCVDLAFESLINLISEKTIMAERKTFKSEIDLERKKILKFDLEAIHSNKSCC